MENLYLWETPEDTENSDVGAYEKSLSPDRFIFLAGKKVSQEEGQPMPVFTFELEKRLAGGCDNLPNNSGSPLVSKKIVDLLISLAPQDVQFFPAKVICVDGELEGYFMMNITCLVDSIDLDASIYSILDLPGGLKMISSIKKLVFKKDCMKGHGIARDQSRSSIALVSQTIFDAFQREKITGVWLATPREYYGLMYPKFQ